MNFVVMKFMSRNAERILLPRALVQCNIFRRKDHFQGGGAEKQSLKLLKGLECLNKTGKWFYWEESRSCGQRAA